MRGLSLAMVSVVMAVLAVALVGSFSASLAQEGSDPAPTPAESSVVIRGWPGARPGNNPPGLYSWYPSGRSWMHRVPSGWTEAAPNSVELTFVAGSPQVPGSAQRPDIPDLTSSLVFRSWWDVDVSSEPEPVLDVRTQVWLLDVGASRVAIMLDSFPDTDPALVAEAEAVVESIRVKLVDAGTRYRLVFELPAGWDSG